MIKITYDPIDGMAVPDGKIAEVVASIVECANKPGLIELSFSTENIIIALRIELVRNNIPTDTQFWFRSSRDRCDRLVVNKYGMIIDWPRGFCDTTGELALTILKLSYKKQRELKNANKR